MPSIPDGKPATVPSGSSVPSLVTWNSSTVPVSPVSAYRKSPLEVRSIGPGFVVAATALSSDGCPDASISNELSVLLAVFETK